MQLKRIRPHFDRLLRKQAMEEARAIKRICIGHKPEEVAEFLGLSEAYVNSCLDLAGIGEVVELPRFKK